jgi:four helix bundle protein
MDILGHHQQLRLRTKEFSYRVIKLYRSLPRNAEAYTIGKQLLRCGTSVAANYRAVGRARSKADFVSKIAIVLEEADESVYWLECIADNNIVRAELLSDLIAEANQLVNIFSASLQTAKSNTSS